jgi:hypothetical protein
VEGTGLRIAGASCISGHASGDGLVKAVKATFFVRAQFKENMSVIVGGGYSDWIPRDIYKERR